MYDINNRTRPRGLQILQKRSGVPSVRVGRVYALGRKVVEFLKVGVHDNLLFVGVLERFGAFDGIFALRADGGTPSEARNIASHDCSLC